MWVSSWSTSRYTIFSSPVFRYPSPATTFPASSSMYMYMSSGTTSMRQSRRTSSRSPSGKIARKATDLSRPGNTSRMACFPAFTLRFARTTGMGVFPSSASKKKPCLGTSTLRRCKPAGEVLPVLLPPSGIHPDLVHGRLDHPANLRSLAAPEEALHVLRRLGSRKGLGDLHEPTDEEPGLRVPPVQLGPVLLDEGPGEVPSEAWTARRHIRDHQDGILGTDRIREGPAEGLLEEPRVPRFREGQEESDLLFLQSGLLFQVPQGFVGRRIRRLSDEGVHESSQIRVQARGILQRPRESLRGLGENPAVLVMSETTQDRRALQGVEVALAGLRIPAAPLAGRAEQVASVGIKAVEVRFIGDQRLEIVQRFHDHPPCGDVVLIAVLGRQLEERRRRKVAGPRQVIGVVLEADPVRRVELLRGDRPPESGPFLGGVIHPVKARLSGVHLDPIVVGAPAGTSQGLRGFRLLQEETRGIPLPRASHMDGDFPRRPFLGLPEDVAVQEAGLGQSDPGLSVLPRHLHVEEREARLLGPGAHDGPDRLPGGRLQGAPQVLRPSVPVAVLPQVAPKAAAERRLAEEPLEHPQDRRTLAVADLVENLPDLRRVLHIHFDRMGAAEPVERSEEHT